MAWVYLVIAGIFEWGWPVGLKLGWTEKGVHFGHTVGWAFHRCQKIVHGLAFHPH